MASVRKSFGIWATAILVAAGFHNGGNPRKKSQSVWLDLARLPRSSVQRRLPCWRSSVACMVVPGSGPAHRRQVIHVPEGDGTHKRAVSANAKGKDSYSALMVHQLRAALQQRGLSSEGCRSDLLERLCHEGLEAGGHRRGDQSAAQNGSIVRIAQLTVGQKMRGEVKRIYAFGALVDVGAEQAGLVRNTRMSQRYIEKPESVLTVGQVVDVWVYRAPENGKLGLTMIPWEKSESKDPLSVFKSDHSSWFASDVFFDSPFGFYVNVAVPQELGGGVVQGVLKKSVSNGASIGSSLNVRVLRVDLKTGTLDLSALPINAAPN